MQGFVFTREIGLGVVDPARGGAGLLLEDFVSGAALRLSFRITLVQQQSAAQANAFAVMTTLHFAYGANMSRAVMKKYAPGARALGVAELAGHRFVITADGYASVEPARAQSVHGVLWRITPREAGEHAKAADVKAVLLTHMSDEMDELWARREAEAGFGGPVHFAHEGAVFNI